MNYLDDLQCLLNVSIYGYNIRNVSNDSSGCFLSLVSLLIKYKVVYYKYSISLHIYNGRGCEILRQLTIAATIAKPVAEYRHVCELLIGTK